MINDNNFYDDDALKIYEYMYPLEYSEDGILEIICRTGSIKPYSASHLMFYGDFVTRRRLNDFIRKLPGFATITQEAETELVFKFPNERLNDLKSLLRFTIPKKPPEKQGFIYKGCA